MKNFKTKIFIFVAFALCVNMAYSQIDYAKAKLLAYIVYEDEEGNAQKYFGLGETISKQVLLNSTGLGAEWFDSVRLELGVKYAVLSFQVHIIGTQGTKIELSNGRYFSDKQKTEIAKLQRGTKFFITNIRAIRPDELERILHPIEVIIN